MVKVRKRLPSAVVAAVVLSLSATARPLACFNCRFDGETRTLRLNGPTDADMLACVEAVPPDGAAVIRLTSRGGSVETALSIAEVIDGWDAHIQVLGECNSSCANFILPVARRITVQPSAMVVLHGSVDPGLVAQVETGEQRALLQAVADRQARFAERHSIGPGWLLYRERYGEGISGVGGLTGTLLGDVPLSRARRLVVSELMLRSCLPNIEVDPFSDTVADRAVTSEAVRERLRRRGAVVSGSLRCV